MPNNKTAYIIETNDTIKEVEVISSDNDFVTVRYGYTESHYLPGGKHHITAKGGMRIRKSRIYDSLLDAQLVINKKQQQEKEREAYKILRKFK